MRTNKLTSLYQSNPYLLCGNCSQSQSNISPPIHFLQIQCLEIITSLRNDAIFTVPCSIGIIQVARRFGKEGWHITLTSHSLWRIEDSVLIAFAFDFNVPQGARDETTYKVLEGVEVIHYTKLAKSLRRMFFWAHSSSLKRISVWSSMIKRIVLTPESSHLIIRNQDTTEHSKD